MTEADWLKERQHSQAMWETLRARTKVTRTKAGKRKLRLFGCGCCRLIWEHLQDRRLRTAVEVAERFADGQADKLKLAAAFRSVLELSYGSYSPDTPENRATTAGLMALSTTSPHAHAATSNMTAVPLPLAGHKVGERAGDGVLCDLFRCVFGNPFRPVRCERSWLAWNDGTLRQMAQAIYVERAFDRLPVLADALEDAGCDNAEILDHCRAGGIHVRGCWAIDLLLGKG